MDIIVTHTNTDFDALASLIAANKLYPDARIVLSSKLGAEVNYFLGIYKDTFTYIQETALSEIDAINRIIYVDANEADRAGDFLASVIANAPEIFIYDHHQITEKSLSYDDGTVEPVGATITILTEKMMAQQIEISPFEATLFALGIYADTGSFTYENTTSRDLSACSFLLSQGANLQVINQFLDTPLSDDQYVLFQKLLENMERINIDGTEIGITVSNEKIYTGHLATITKKLLLITGYSLVVAIVKMNKKTFLTIRSNSERINGHKIAQLFNGGGHKGAAAATINEGNLESIQNKIKTYLHQAIQPGSKAEEIMSSPVRVISPDSTIETTSKMLYRYGHTGFPVVKNKEIVGIISRRDIDKALHHQLGHAPVKGFMSRKPLSVSASTSIDEVQELMINKQVGRLPVLKDDELVGIISRSDIIEYMHGESKRSLFKKEESTSSVRRKVTKTMEKHLSADVFSLLITIMKLADKEAIRIYLIGGIVRDILLNRNNEDIDIVIEGNAMDFAHLLKKEYGGHIRTHEEFETASWAEPNGIKIDLTSARTEYYDFPAALPKVEQSSIKEDLFRRDFTINAMAISINHPSFGELIDFFNGYEDLKKKELRILYNLSFIEDPTRILRAIRFQSRLGFKMNDQTYEMAKESALTLQSVSKKRISNELNRLFTGQVSSLAIEQLLALNLEKYIFTHPESATVIRDRTYYLNRIFQDPLKSLFVNDSYRWVIILLAFHQHHELQEDHLSPFFEKKEEVKIVKDVIILLNNINSSEASLLKTNHIYELHDYYSPFSNEAIISLSSFFVPAKIQLAERSIAYISLREKLQGSFTGSDLIKAGYKPNSNFKYYLHYAMKMLLIKPSYSKDEIINLIKRKFF